MTDHGFMVMTWKPKLNHRIEEIKTASKEELNKITRNDVWRGSRIEKTLVQVYNTRIWRGLL